MPIWKNKTDPLVIHQLQQLTLLITTQCVEQAMSLHSLHIWIVFSATGLNYKQMLTFFKKGS